MEKKYFDKFNGEDVCLYAISNGRVEAEICDLGAEINALMVDGVNITLGFDSVEDYLQSGSFAGATIGRVANRIAGGKFILNGKTYLLNNNEGNNHLHGGNAGFDKRIFKVLRHTANSIELQYVSADMEENYPGELKLNVTYTVENDALTIRYAAVSNKDTLWNPTNHSYFNLNGEANGDCKNIILQLNADYYTPADGELIPTGKREAVKGTVFDFNAAKKIGADFGHKDLVATNGYDHNYILKGEHAAHAESEVTGIKMDVYTDMPCIQLYTGGALKTSRGKSRTYTHWAGFCLEPQYCPNAINAEGFKKPVLPAGQPMEHYIKYQF